jgi:cytochrome c
MKKYLLFVVGCAAVLGFSTIPEATASPAGKCKACHSFSDKNKVGPGLKGIMGRKAGTHPGFKYSDSLKNADWVWDEDHLRKWVHNSKKAIKEFTGDSHARTKMGKQNVKGKKADKLIAFLKTI